MAYTSIDFEHPQTGEIILEAPVGFSWTVLFFGFFPPLFRCDWKWAVIMFILASVTSGLSNFVFMFIYNELYIEDLVCNGFKVIDIEEGTIDELSRKLGTRLPEFKNTE